MARKISATAEQICTAIQDKRLLMFDYNGQSRVVEPYCLGLSTQDAELLRAIQVAGASHSRRFGFGKLWTLEQMKAVRVAEQTFVPDDPNYNPNDSAMKLVICNVDAPSKKRGT
jgi:hypothetical protein